MMRLKTVKATNVWISDNGYFVIKQLYEALDKEVSIILSPEQVDAIFLFMANERDYLVQRWNEGKEEQEYEEEEEEEEGK